ncbi:alpha/beta fold hydrolase [Pseudonocardia sp. TRM90224]|uniref:alpha/beta fold hydrolase n=1 Tax=Pseudonocardia sp. TRM90224 TaxID=2812678 RepID=UPI001E4E1EE2|nr:alpha/beta hydrolase [Pseudonocardia sp. TRM90224]
MPESRVPHLVVVRPPAAILGRMITDVLPGRRVIVPRDPGGPDLDAAVADTVGNARAVAEPPWDVVGESVGALLAAAIAARRQLAVRRLVLIGGWASSSGPAARFAADLRRDLLATDPDLVGRLTVLLGFSPPALGALGEGGIVHVLAEQDEPTPLASGAPLDITALLPHVVAPTLVIGFAQDQLVPVDGARTLHAGIRGSRYVELPGGHYDWLLEPDRLLGTVARFLDDPLLEGHRPQVGP